MTAPELKPCPFCGGKAAHNDGGNSVYGRFWWSVGCPTCDIWLYDREVWSKSEPGMLDKAFPPAECLTRWNTRTTDPLLAEALARLAQNFDTYADDCDECTRRGMGSKTKNKHRAECWREAATDVREAAAAIHKSLKEAINGSA